jgi:hypothetical protein
MRGITGTALRGIAMVAVVQLLTECALHAKPGYEWKETKGFKGEKCAAYTQTATDGTGPGFAKIRTCVTESGNVKMHGISRNRTVQDAYRICADNGGQLAVVASDYGPGEGTGFKEGSPTISQPNGPGTFPLTITRTTLSPEFLVTQLFTQSTGTDPDVNILVTLEHLGPADKVDSVRFIREFDRERPWLGAWDTLNDWWLKQLAKGLNVGSVGVSTESAFGWTEGEGYGLMLTTPFIGAFLVNHEAGVYESLVVESEVDQCGAAHLPDMRLGGDYFGRLVLDVGTIHATGVGSPNEKFVSMRYWIF